MIQHGISIVCNAIVIGCMGSIILTFERMAPSTFFKATGWTFVVLGIGFGGFGAWAIAAGVLT